MGQKESVLTIHLEIYAPLAAAAGSLLEMKALALPMVLPLDENGWTKEYTPRQLLKALGLSRSKAQETKLLAVLESWKAAGRIKIEGNCYQFGWVKNPQSGDGIPTSGEILPAKVGTESPKGGNFPTSKGESKAAPLNQNQNLSESDILIDKSGLLGSIGVGANNYHLAEAWSFEELSALITEARSNAKIRNLPAFVVARLKERGSQRDFEKVRQEFERWIGHITPNMLQDFQRLISTYPIEQILDGIQECKYTSLWTLKAKLENWRVNGRKLPKPAIKIADPDEVVVGIPLWVRQKEAVSNGG